MRLTIGPAVVGGLAIAITVFLGDAVTRDAAARRPIALIIIFGLAGINTRGVKPAGGFQLVVTICKVTGLALLVGSVAVVASVGTVAGEANTPSALNPAGFGGALLAAMAAYNGWANASLIGGEARDPERVVPWALAWGVGVVTILYVVANVVYLRGLGLDGIAAANSTAHPTAPSVAAMAARRFLGGNVAGVLPILFALSALGTAHCNFLAQPRVFYVMAQDGLLPRALVRLSPRSGTPNRAIWMFAGLAAVFAWFGTYDRLTNMTAFAFYVFFGLTTCGFLLSMRDPHARSGTRYALLWIAIAIVFLCGTIALLITSFLRGSVELLTASALIASGVPIYGLVEVLRCRRT
jgi:APA family basic amino acid/polyamine antiporter